MEIIIERTYPQPTMSSSYYAAGHHFYPQQPHFSMLHQVYVPRRQEYVVVQPRCYTSPWQDEIEMYYYQQRLRRRQREMRRQRAAALERQRRAELMFAMLQEVADWMDQDSDDQEEESEQEQDLEMQEAYEYMNQEDEQEQDEEQDQENNDSMFSSDDENEEVHDQKENQEDHQDESRSIPIEFSEEPDVHVNIHIQQDRDTQGEPVKIPASEPQIDQIHQEQQEPSPSTEVQEEGEQGQDQEMLPSTEEQEQNGKVTATGDDSTFVPINFIDDNSNSISVPIQRSTSSSPASDKKLALLQDIEQQLARIAEKHDSMVPETHLHFLENSEVVATTTDNKLFLGMEDEVIRIMLQLDAIESDGDQEIRNKRKALIHQAQKLLDILDEHKQREWEKASSDSSSSYSLL